MVVALFLYVRIRLNEQLFCLQRNEFYFVFIILPICLEK